MVRSFGLRRAFGVSARIAAAVASATLVTAGTGCSGPTYETGRLGRLELRVPHEDPRAIAFLFSDAGGWSAAESTAATSLERSGVLVVGIDLARYREALDASDGECLYLLSEIESLSQQIQRKLAVQSYASPILSGIGEGGALAAAALAQSPYATVAGAVAVDPAAVVRTRLPLCPGAPSRRSERGWSYGAAASLPGFLSIGFTSGADASGRAHAEEIVHGGDGVIDDAASRDPSASSPPELLAKLVLSHVPKNDDVSPRDRDLASSLVELPADAPTGALVVVLSGDGGWRDLDKTIAGYLQGQGVNVVGWDSLRYFWHEKTPERVAADLDAILRRYGREWHATDVALVGYSFGADVLPFAYNRLPPESKAMVRQLSLLGFSDSADFEIHVSGWLGGGSTDKALPLAPEMERIPLSMVQCFYGRDEDDTQCPVLAARGVETIATAGDHHFDGDYDALARSILAGFARRGANLPPARRAAGAAENR